ncbi:tRNA 2-selenouridine(34) synthase MnmH [Halomonas urumqiensis]|uniref:tRNA 2-selenouridine(34) synthase MnmH n=1 Tax=Halomonas urumqiensis TaxID=1684789 RepID=A0A2N7UL86_9GAMM|nr:tRNA 2-selenouridine(34) synthase MnmH [Halomonas urumqiensis]PMR81210.1 tRNA 2-selenouridine(34) synthase MnmH [Halomonas urumqiensis]PTB01779.1 tRNA 2-selenouridine(34) synthase MnmH [Halomonas urumqiensis]GHE22116.1 tRNA 2-selenouridine synthase [Halomonas urumqiensis]
MSLPLVEPDLSLLRESRVLIDVRAPVEFAQGALPGAVNLPLMDDDERHLVGIEYKQRGQQAAIALGETLVSDGVKAARVAAWQGLLERHPDALIYCFRGGLRSQVAQQWMAEAGMLRPRIRGGWKAMRRGLCERIDSAARQPLLVVGGLTGCAKTALITALDNGLDLEGCARHKGSAFGRHPLPAPSQIDFEHAMGRRLLDLPGPLVVEDESRHIGTANIPLCFWGAMEQAPRLRVEMPLDWRLAQIHKDYIDDLWDVYRYQCGEWLGWSLMRKQLSSSLARLRKRLGSARLARLQRLQQLAFREHERGNRQAHEAWLAPLLTEYYDPMYRYQLEKHPERRFLHVGDWDSCLAAAREWTAEARAQHSTAASQG